MSALLYNVYVWVDPPSSFCSERPRKEEEKSQESSALQLLGPPSLEARERVHSAAFFWWVSTGKEGRSMLLLNSHLLLLLLYCQSQVVRAYSSNGAENCLPRCCSQGQILDPSGTACLKNPATQILPDPCGRRDSFLPQCELENNEEDEGKKGKKIFFLFK